mmetsp:Transcript_13526/g.23742  ORF Transcript_13526/g.23742 Transcript_13526/m.23742 type:complete len:289 (-) Transcript_13526:816-1682(-)
MSDPLFPVRNSFYLGAYNTVINEAADLSDLTELQAVERDCYVHRSYVALGSHELVLSEIGDSAATALQAVKLLAKYTSGRASKEAVLTTLSEWLADPACSRNPLVLLVAGILYLREGNYGDALRTCHAANTLELQALCVQTYLMMDRPDKAEQVVKAMSAVDDDATITQLATAWLGLALGGAKLQEASYIYQELGEKYNWTPMLYNGRAVCNFKAGEWEDAERDLLEALAKDAKDPDTLANLITCGLQLGKSTARYSSQLKIVAPDHPITKRLATGNDLFSQAAASMA